jgi:hypothetical protein
VRGVKFVKRKKSGLGDEWRHAHVTVINVNVKTEGKPVIPGEAFDKIDEAKLLEHYMRQLGVHNYRIVYHETLAREKRGAYPLEVKVDELEELFDKYPECEAIGGFDENLACLEEKTGKKFVLLYLEPGRVAVAEIL